jgi:hypothetical protein
MTTDLSASAVPRAHALRHSAARPLRRARFANLLLACALIAVADDPAVTLAVGGATILLAALIGLTTAFARTRSTWQTVAPPTVAVWMLGLAALVIAGAGVTLAQAPAVEPAWRAVGLALFAAQITLILWLDTTASPADPRGGR